MRFVDFDHVMMIELVLNFCSNGLIYSLWNEIENKTVQMTRYFELLLGIINEILLITRFKVSILLISEFTKSSESQLSSYLSVTDSLQHTLTLYDIIIFALPLVCMYE